MMVSLSIVPLSYKSSVIFLLEVDSLLINLFSLPNKTQGSASSLLLPGLLLVLMDSLLTSLFGLLVSESLVAGDVFITIGSDVLTTGVFDNTVLLFKVVAGNFCCVEVFTFGLAFTALFATIFTIGLVVILLLDSFDLTILLGFLPTTAVVVLFTAVDAIGVFVFFTIALFPPVFTAVFAIFLMSPSFSKYTFPPPQSLVPFSLLDI